MTLMKKILFLLPLFLLVGCSKNNEDSYFTKKQECAKYIEQVEQEVNFIRESKGSAASQPEVFYSPKLDTCISTWTLLSYSSNIRTFEINDLLTKKQIYFRVYSEEEIKELSKQSLTGFEEYNAKKEELMKK